MDMWVIITAAGRSTRMEGLGNKLALNVGGRPVLCLATEAFVKAGLRNIVVVVPPGEHAMYTELLEPLSVTFAEGGMTRQESVYNGLKVLPSSCKYVLIHDGARPNVSESLIRRVAESTVAANACIPVIPVSDTVYEVEQGQLSVILQRDKLGAVQTPQGFSRELILSAHEHAYALGLTATDDGALVKLLGHSVAIVEGEFGNTKITRPEDLLKHGQGSMQMRTGMGMDVHRLVEGRKLILAGVHVPSQLGLLGHSDADVVAHAVMDAILGALGQGDIGTHFPDSDERYRGANSLDLLAYVTELVAQKQGIIHNIDVTLLLEKPKIAPFRESMRSNLAQTLGIALDRVNVKATTNEGLGYIGAGEGAVCYAVATVSMPAR